MGPRFLESGNHVFNTRGEGILLYYSRQFADQGTHVRVRLLIPRAALGKSRASLPGQVRRMRSNIASVALGEGDGADPEIDCGFPAPKEMTKPLSALLARTQNSRYRLGIRQGKREPGGQK
jgi:hypothetical protein